MKDACSYRFDGICKDPAEDFPVTLDFYPIAVIEWQPNELYALGNQVRPRTPNGFAYQAGGAGTSSGKEPRWPTSLGATVVDGGLTWTCIAAASNALNAVSAPSGTSDPSGITVSGVSVDEDRKVLATYSGGVLGQTYDIVWQVTIATKVRIARQRIEVRKR